MAHNMGHRYYSNAGPAWNDYGDKLIETWLGANGEFRLTIQTGGSYSIFEHPSVLQPDTVNGFELLVNYHNKGETRLRITHGLNTDNWVNVPIRI